MWTRLLVVVIVVLFLFAGIYVLKKEPSPAVKGETRDPETQALKVAKNVVMYEKRSDTDKTFVIRARVVTQQSEKVFFMEAFSMDRSDGMKVEGARARYDTGLSSYLEVLIADQQLFSQEIELARVRGSQYRAVTQLYRALGGGWQQPAGH